MCIRDSINAEYMGPKNTFKGEDRAESRHPIHSTSTSYPNIVPSPPVFCPYSSQGSPSGRSDPKQSCYLPIHRGAIRKVKYSHPLQEVRKDLGSSESQRPQIYIYKEANITSSKSLDR
eukprot:TRINITY_DN53108_c0_g1_i4.p2 TRINITY_DN53108_c0_g1~~TRINITY_DN53108_c0_g1_i4.p2  ORF type:complete len:118 (+),score=7.56 TRINITY_DN53108_c0_g1_i4:145-498(+)